MSELSYEGEIVEEISNQLQATSVLSLERFFTQAGLIKWQALLDVAKWQLQQQITSHQFHSAPIDSKEAEELTNFANQLIQGQWRWEFRKFAHKDFTVLHDGKQAPVAECIIDLSTNWDTTWGGGIIVVDGSGEFTALPAKQNSASLMLHTISQSFIEYINNHANNQTHLLLYGWLE